MVDGLILGERQRVARPVHAGRGRVHEVRDARVAAAFDHVTERRQVVPEIRLRIDERVAHARLRGEMNDVRERVVAEEPVRRLGIGEVDALEPEAWALGQPREARFLQRDVVVRIEIVDTQHGHPGVEELCRRVHADETGAAGDEHAAHCGSAHLATSARFARS